jgi:hypothetical protein
VSWPGVVPAGVVSDAPFAFWDVLPTLAGEGRRGGIIYSRPLAVHVALSAPEAF